MTVQVETFECQETAAEPIEACEEAIRLAESLGLEGQLEMTRPKSDDNQPTRSPYREMTQEEIFVYSVLCPEKVNASKYSRSPIPLRVLQVLSHAKSIGMFNTFEIWDKASQEIKDPVLVAFDKDSYAWNRKAFILARWGEELETPSVLLKRAITIVRERLTQEAEAVERQAKTIASVVQDYTDAQIMKAGAAATVSMSKPEV